MKSLLAYALALALLGFAIGTVPTALADTPICSGTGDEGRWCITIVGPITGPERIEYAHYECSQGAEPGSNECSYECEDYQDPDTGQWRTRCEGEPGTSWCVPC